LAAMTPSLVQPAGVTMTTGICFSLMAIAVPDRSNAPESPKAIVPQRFAREAAPAGPTTVDLEFPHS